MRGRVNGAFLRFLLVGLANTGFGYAAYALLVLAGLGAQAALALAFVLGVLWNYLGHARFVFGTAGFGRLPAYGAAYLAVWAVNAGALALLGRAGLAPLAAQALLVLPSAALSFLLVGRVLTGAFPGFRRGAGEEA